MTTQTQQQLSAVLSQLAGVLDGVDDPSRPTPCTEYDVAALRAHTVGWLTAFTDGFEAADGQCSNPDAVQISGTGGDQVRDLATRLDRALANGAAERPLRIGDAEMPGDLSLQMMLWEYQMHGWDLARATGQQWSPAEDGVVASLDFAPAMLTEDYQGEGKSFGPRVDVPADAPAIDRLAGLSGRDPNWSAS